MVVGVTKLGFNHKQSLEVMPNSQFFRYPHAAMCLHCVFTYEKRSLASLQAVGQEAAPANCSDNKLPIALRR